MIKTNLKYPTLVFVELEHYHTQKEAINDNKLLHISDL